MTGNEYQKLAMRTNDGQSRNRLYMHLYNRPFSIHPNPDTATLLEGCLGLSGEVGEFNDVIKKWIFHNHKLSTTDVVRELGDILWYISLICHSLSLDMDKIMLENICKLQDRYPDGFDTQRSINRDDDSRNGREYHES